MPKHVDVSTPLARDPKLLKTFIGGMKRRKGHPLILIGCAPCQGFSFRIVTMKETGDVRNSLFVDLHGSPAHQTRCSHHRNVPELLTNKYWPFVKKQKLFLWLPGYSIYVGVHNMAEFGVPQERFRAVMLALPRCFSASSCRFLELSSFRTVRQSIGKLRAVKAGEPDRLDR